MSIRLKIVSVVLLSVGVLSLLAYVVSRNMLLESYLAIERDATEENLARTHNTIKNNVTELTVKLRDWAQWDDAYNFVHDRNQAFADANLQYAALYNVEINLMMFTTLGGELIAERSVDLDETREISDGVMAAEVLRQLRSIPDFMSGKGVEGMLSLPDGLMFISALPVNSSDGLAPVEGMLTFGRYFDKAKVARFEEVTQLPIELFPYEASAYPDDVARAKENFSASNDSFIEPLSKETIAAYSLLYDLSGKPVNILRITTPRHIFNQGLNTFKAFLIIAGASILAFGIVIVLLTEHLLLTRIRNLSKDVSVVGTAHDLSKRVAVTGKDEISGLATSVNNMIAALAKAQADEAALRKSEQETNKKLSERVEEIEKMNKLMVNRELRMAELKQEIARSQKPEN